ncbi:MAG: DUF3857 domain-containing protein [Bacteroidales bacterium]|nr:DUF3857 domain-containing protein [Bacteroidales bacterium]
MKHLSIILLMLPALVFSQNFLYKKLNLDTITSIDKNINAQVEKYHAVILKDHKISEFHFVLNNLYLFNTEYRKVLINSEKGIDYFNRVYISAGEFVELVQLQVRTITPQGKIVVLNKDNIKQIENLENSGSYLIFAIDGIEKGSIVEVLYTLKEPFRDYSKYSYNDNFPTYSAVYELLTPSHLVFNSKSYNSSFARKDTLMGTNNYTVFNSDTIKTFRKEEYSTWKSNIPKIVYQYSHNASVSLDFNLWASAAQRIQPFFYTERKEDKKIEKLIEKLNIQNLNEVEKIKKIEIFIKDNFEVKEDVGGVQNISDLKFILDKKYTNKEGITLLFVRMLEIAGIKHYVGFTSNRFDSKFDKDFFLWNNLNYYIIYFPNQNKYLVPEFSEYRFSSLPDEISNNYGLFINNVNIGEHKTILPDIKFIHSVPMENNFTKQYYKVSFDETFSTAIVDYKLELGGDEANYIKPYYDFLPETSKKEVVENLLKQKADDSIIEEVKVTNSNHNISSFDETFTIESKLKIASLIESAGDNFIFKVGEIIGPQVEMYDEHERDNPIELRHVHFYHRIINIPIPQGFIAKGLEMLNMSIEFGSNAENTMGFVSKYTVENNIISIDVYEYYKSIEYSLSQYEQFRSVINAAADFNKLSIVFQKQ